MDSIAQTGIEQVARQNNSVTEWNRLWEAEGEGSWRAEAMRKVYERIVEIVATNGAPERSVIDVGGGRGLLMDLLKASVPQALTTVIDHSDAALAAAVAKGHNVHKQDLEAQPQVFACDTYVCTEVIEHLSAASRESLIDSMKRNGSNVLLTVPNDRLGPDEEPQHTIKFTAASLKKWLNTKWQRNVRVEVHGAYLLAVCGAFAAKNYTLSVCLPARDEAHDLERTLASFRGVADEMVVGIDPRSKDGSYEVAEKYADVVFFLNSPEGVVGTKGYMGANGVNFAHVRNQVSAKCTGDWIFMTEGHEPLGTGQDTLLRLTDVIPKAARVGFVFRKGQGQRWMFPWLYKNDPDMVWRRPVHNVLEFPEGTFAVQLPQVMTLHERHHERSSSRAVQRKSQNRRQLMDDWHTEKNVNSLFYLGQEWRELDKRRAIDNLDKFINVSNNGVQKYQARLILAKECMRDTSAETRAAARKLARDYLMGCTADDWSRTEHWVWLGDLAYEDGDFEKSHKFYRYASTSIGEPPMTMWWIDLCYYSYVPAQRLAMITAELGRIAESLHWAQQVKVLLPEDAPQEAHAEADKNIETLTEALRQANEVTR